MFRPDTPLPWDENLLPQAIHDWWHTIYFHRRNDIAIHMNIEEIVGQEELCVRAIVEVQQKYVINTLLNPTHTHINKRVSYYNNYKAIPYRVQPAFRILIW